MSDHQKFTPYERKITSIERFFTRSPFSIVTVVARIRGEVTGQMLAEAVAKVQRRHTNLRVRIREDDDHTPWFTSAGVGEIPIEVVPRASGDDWIEVHRGASQVPFEFHERPAIRFILVQSPQVSELIILCHHILCDGLSLAYLARDLMVHLGDPEREVQVLPDPVPIDPDNMPEDVSLNAIVRFFINRFNKKWQGDEIYFDQADYRDLNQAYWDHFSYQVIPVELSEAQTSGLVERCRGAGVTVNSALAAGFLGAQSHVQGDQPDIASIGVAADLRGRLPIPAGESMGFYAGVINLEYCYDRRSGFWDNARRFHQTVGPLFTNKNLFNNYLTWCYLDPAIIEAINFKKLGGLVPPEAAGHAKLSAFSQRADVVRSLLKRDGLDSLDHKIYGIGLTNLTRLDFPRAYGALQLERLILQPGGAVPLTNVNFVVGAVTCSGKLSLALEYAEQAVDTPTMAGIREQALEFLMSHP